MSSSTRRIRAILTLMLEQGACFVMAQEQGEARLLSKTQVPLLKIPPDLIFLLQSTGLLVLQDGAWQAADEARAWLKRQGSAEGGFRAQHMRIERAGADGPQINQDESPLTWLRSRRGKAGTAYIDEAQFAAGERLRADFTRGQMTPRTTANWEQPMGGQGGANAIVDFQEGTIAARQRVQAALTAIGPELSGVVLDVCCFLKGLEQVERERIWPARTAKVVLGLGLTRLAAHYGISAQATGREHGPLRHWGAQDYRPAFEVPVDMVG
jgi:hypothetical protein